MGSEWVRTPWHVHTLGFPQTSSQYDFIPRSPCLEHYHLPKPSQILLNWLGSYNSDEQEKILKVREQILSFDKRIQEVTETKSIKYGRGKTKPCAEFCFERKSKKIILFLWMPIPNRKIQAVGRMQIGITDDCEGYWATGHQPNGIGKMEIGEMHLYFLMEENERVSGYLDDLVNEALETWIRRL